MGRGEVSTPTPKPMPEKTPKPHERGGEIAPPPLKPELLYTKWNFMFHTDMYPQKTL